MPFFCIHCKAEIDPSFKACPFCGEPMTDFLRRYLEAPIDGKYQILTRLGVGGMGEVYKVLHIHLNSVRVVKLMRTAIAGDPAAHERFLREARLATKIHHPNVATLFDFSTMEDGVHYMVWEHIEGINLHELIAERGPLSPRYAAKLAIQALQGLDAIHRAGIVHRDVSPENLMITRDDDGEERVKIIDLGIAKQDAEGETQTKTGMFVGKWKYCSPEHLGMLSEGERIDGRADIYSFGIVLYEMLTGVPPFQASTPHGFFLMHSSETPKPLREVNPGVTACPELEALIFRALEKDRGNRFQTARAFAQALEAVLPSLADAPGAPPPLPATAEVTDEATRMTPRAGKEYEPTVLTDPPRALPQLAVPPEPEPKGEGLKLAGIAAILLILVGIGAAVLWGNRTDGTSGTDATNGTATEAAVLPPTTDNRPPTTTRVAINAFPWANVTSIRNVASGETVDAPQLVTPAPLDLAPGRYDITLSNPAYAKPITRTVDVVAGREVVVNVEFVDPDRAPLPDFGGAR